MKKQLGIAYILFYFGFGFAILALMPQPVYAEGQSSFNSGYIIDSSEFGENDVIHTINVVPLDIKNNLPKTTGITSKVKDSLTTPANPDAFFEKRERKITSKPAAGIGISSAKLGVYPKKNKTITVFYKETKPFLTDDNGIPHGKVAEIVKDYGVVHGIIMKFVKVITMDDLIADVEKTKNSFGMGAISITPERLAHVNFSVPYQFGDISLVFSDEITYAAMWETVKKVTMAFRPLLIAVFLTAIALTFCASPTWRRFWNKLWLSLVTGTTTGFDDNGSDTTPERIVLGIWMIASIFIFSIFNASVFVTLNNQVNTDYNPTSVGVVAYTQGANICADKGYNCKPYDNIKKMVKAFKSKHIDAMVYDEDIIKMYVNNVAYKTLKTDMYGIIMNKSMNTYKMNRLIP